MATRNPANHLDQSRLKESRSCQLRSLSRSRNIDPYIDPLQVEMGEKRDMRVGVVTWMLGGMFF